MTLKEVALALLASVEAIRDGEDGEYHAHCGREECPYREMFGDADVLRAALAAQAAEPRGKWTREPSAEDDWCWTLPDYEGAKPVLAFWRKGERGFCARRWSVPIPVPPQPEAGGREERRDA